MAYSFESIYVMESNRLKKNPKTTWEKTIYKIKDINKRKMYGIYIEKNFYYDQLKRFGSLRAGDVVYNKKENKYYTIVATSSPPCIINRLIRYKLYYVPHKDLLEVCPKYLRKVYGIKI